MRLLNVQSLEFREFYASLPPYVVASHRWKRETEASLEDVRHRLNQSKEGVVKVKGFVEFIKTYVPHVEWLWIDTCCINQESSQEVSEAINSMFEWYREAELCLAYLADVTTKDDPKMFEASDWFRRGWTLQELLAPRTVIFLTSDWQVIGYKGSTGAGKSGIDVHSGPSLTDSLVAITRVPESALNDFSQSKEFTAAAKLEWMAGRETLRPEDLSYSLFGIFGVSIPVLYGEGKEKARKRLLEEVYKENSTLTSQFGAPQQSALVIPFRRDRDFVNRKGAIEGMRSKFGLPAARVALVGLGGAGKSQLAIEYAYQLREQSPSRWVFWIYASNEARFESGVRELADAVKLDCEDPKADVFRLVRNWLQEAKAPWTVVLDNVDDAGFLIERGATREQRDANGAQSGRSLFECFPVCDHGSILITSRSEAEALKLVERSDIVEVSPMDQETAVELLEKKLGQKQEDEKAVLEIVEALECMPLAITQAAAYIKQRGRRCSVQQYAEKLRRGDRSKQDVLVVDAGDLRRDQEAQNSIILTWQISFEHIQQIRSSASELLALMSFCDRHAIPEALVRTQRTNVDDGNRSGKDRPTISELIEDGDKDQYDDSSRRSSQSSAADFSDQFDDDLTMLEEYSFISVTTDTSTFEMHRLVQLATQKWLESQGDLQWWTDRYIDHLFNFLPSSGDYENWSAYQVFFPHAKSAAMLKPRGNDALLKWATVMSNAASYALTTGRTHELEEMSVRSWKVRAQLLGEEDERTLQSRALVALATEALGRWQEAEEMLSEVIAIRKRVLGEEHPDTLASMDDLVEVYVYQKKGKEAEALELQVLEARKRVLGEEHARTIMSMDNLAATYLTQGKFDQAEELQVQVVAACKKSGEEHPITLTSMSNLAATYIYQGRWTEAKELGERVLNIRRRVLGEEHPDTLKSTGNLSSTYVKFGWYDKAEEMDTRLLDIRQKVLGKQHPDTLLSMHCLAFAYRQQGRWIEAKKLIEQVVESRTQVLGEQHPDTLTCLSLLASTLRELGQWNRARELGEQALKSSQQILGVNHPDTLSIMSNLASTLRERGDWNEAEKLEQQALSIRRSTLGETNPDTLFSMDCIAMIYQCQERWLEAHEIQLQVSQTRKDRLGEEHPDTLKTLASLAFTYLNLGRDEAMELGERVLNSRKKVLGERHPDTLRSMADVAQIWKAQKRDQAAYDLLRDSVALSSQILGDEHPLTSKRTALLQEWKQIPT